MRSVKKIVSTLERRSELVDLKDYDMLFGIIAKSLKKDFDEVLLFDLADFDRITI